MFCTKCGKKLESGDSFCTNCGQSVYADAAVQKVNCNTDHVTVDMTVNAVTKGKNPLESDRDFFLVLLLTLFTCGIYSLIFMHDLAKDINVACEGDGEETEGAAGLFIFSMITCGIYRLIWDYELGNRLYANAPKYNVSIQENGTTLILWNILGLFICGIGPMVSLYFIIKNSNKICNGYNIKHGFAS